MNKKYIQLVLFLASAILFTACSVKEPIVAVPKTSDIEILAKTANDNFINQNKASEDFFKKYPLVCMHIYHSLGRVNAGEISLFVFVSAVHRKAAINACEEIVERIKKEVPIWGKEILGNENFQWKENS